jgi:energy-coupling factor transport system permease protein
MRLFTPLRPDPRAALARANPVSKLGAAALLMTVLFLSIDAVTPGVILLGLIGALPLSGLGPADLVRRTWPILLGALLVGLLNAVFAARTGGDVAVAIGPLAISSQNLVAGMGLGLRLLAIALSGLLALATTDPTDLADALMQQLRLSPRFAIGSLAAARLLPIFSSEWQTLTLARRARGLAAERSPVAAVRIFFGQLLTLLISAVRRGTRLATAMEARGFGTRPCRSVARPQRMHVRDWILLGLAAALAAVAVGVSVALGSWRFMLG